MTSLAALRATMPTWGLWAEANGDLLVGPLAEFGVQAPLLTVTLIPDARVPPGVTQARVLVHENAQSFAVMVYQFDGYHGVRHGRGRNWIVWSDDGRTVYVSHGDAPPDKIWVNVRFVLRHFIVAEWLRRAGYRRLHAVAGSLAGTTASQGVLVVGPYLSGKTYLLQQWIAHGIVSELVEDDCAVIDADWQLACLIPREHELCRTRRMPIRVVVCLDRTASAIEPMPTPQAAVWALGLSASWPVTWLPGVSPIRTDVVHVPAQVQFYRAPECPSATAVAEAIRRLWDVT